VGRALSQRRQEYGDLSLWFGTAEDGTPARPRLTASTECDVVVVGAGFTGLWTAYYLLRDDPSLRVVVLEAETAGYGASGRNGGWCSALFPQSADRLARLPGFDRNDALALRRAMRDTVDEVVRVAAGESIDAHFDKGGTVTVARTPVQLARARTEVEHARSWGHGEDELRLLDAAEARSMIGASRVLGATYTPDCAAIHPGLLVRGLARVVEQLGGVVHESTPVTAIRSGSVETPGGTVRADHVVRATEAYTARLPGHRRIVAPVYSLVVATEPLPGSVWDEIGLVGRPTFSEHRHLVVYGQRTRDGRLVFGGRGAPYHFGSSVSPAHDRDDRVFDHLRRTLRDLFPALDDAAFTHAWGGPLGIRRDWCASVGIDRSTGVAWAGGYVGDGVSTTNLAGRTLRDLILGRRTELTDLPWVQHRSRRWEPEPLRWLGVNAGLRAMGLAETEERLTDRPSRIAAAMAPLLGH
jgi:glycine/D-amino acid oxidase-like deaminating enzyme